MAHDYTVSKAAQEFLSLENENTIRATLDKLFPDGLYSIVTMFTHAETFEYFFNEEDLTVSHNSKSFFHLSFFSSLISDNAFLREALKADDLLNDSELFFSFVVKCDGEAELYPFYCVERGVVVCVFKN